MPETIEQPHTIRFDHNGETLEAVATVKSIERREERVSPLVGGDRIGLEAHMLVLLGDATEPVSYHLSMLVEETDWTIDAKFGPGSYPHWSHGFGVRYLATKGLPVEFDDVLNALAKERGLAEQIGHDTPLILAHA
ncbi:hypothetical protein [Streptomyces sp. NPDC051098]|uniref:hypothetical protein n=1 Tax=Streptomyces sp. NPDC051098 TaxID=3155411 RepID=UPI00342DE402